MVAEFSSKTLTTTYKTADCHTPIGQNVHLYHCRNPLPHTYSYVTVCVNVYHVVFSLEIFQLILSMNY